MGKFKLMMEALSHARSIISKSADKLKNSLQKVKKKKDNSTHFSKESEKEIKEKSANISDLNEDSNPINGRKDGKTWAEAIKDDTAIDKAANIEIGLGKGKKLKDISKAPTSIISDKELEQEKIKGIQDDDITQRENKKKKILEEHEKANTEKTEEERANSKTELEEKEKLSKMSWQEKIRYRRGQNNLNMDIEAFDQLDTQTQDKLTNTDSINLLKSDSTSFFAPSIADKGMPPVNDNSIGLLKQNNDRIPKDILEELQERKGSEINVSEYYQTMEGLEKDIPPPPMDMDLDSGEDGSMEGGNDGGSDGGGEGGGDGGGGGSGGGDGGGD